MSVKVKVTIMVLLNMPLIFRPSKYFAGNLRVSPDMEIDNSERESWQDNNMIG
jgi:hypothetical protein